MHEVARMPAGFVLFAGVTGSGKTTTLKTFIETHPGNGNSAFYSIEDPVEYPLRGVHQIPLQRDLMNRAESAAKYAEVVGALMRGDPDGVLMGEIRDTATALAGQQIVETGHMACGTVHAHLLSGILPRLTNDEIGMSREVLTNPNMLSLLAYQALVPLLCPHCSVTGEELLSETKEEAERDRITNILVSTQKRFQLDAGQLRFKHVGGCEHCNGRGTRGLTVVAEMMIPDRKWLQLSRDGLDYEAVMHYRSASDRNFLSANMNGKTVFEHALFKAMKQKIDPRQCERFDSFNRFEILPNL
jgi:type II secretory ATPase GspE/PulE/Tfp pilus assembly ATPase PilB-like protein